MSKAALHMATIKLASALPNVTVVAINPGWVPTDMGGANAELSREESVTAIPDPVDKPLESFSGAFLDRYGNRMPW